MNVPVILALVAIVVFAVVVVMTRGKDPQQRATTLTRTAAAIMAVFTVLAGIVIVGDSLQNPGGTAAMLITLAWVVPMLVLDGPRACPGARLRGSGNVRRTLCLSASQREHARSSSSRRTRPAR